MMIAIIISANREPQRVAQWSRSAWRWVISPRSVGFALSNENSGVRVGLKKRGHATNSFYYRC
jgi:hypothetical protein